MSTEKWVFRLEPGVSQVPFVCPACGFEKLVAAERLHGLDKPFAIKCRCGAKTSCRVEHRRSRRRQVELRGTYRNASIDEKGEVRIIDISPGGVGLRVLIGNSIEPGHLLRLTFNLDDPRATRVEVTVRVMSVNGFDIGTAYADGRPPKGIGFYLMD